MASGRRFVGSIRYLVNAKGLQLEYDRVFHETLFMAVLMYGSESMIRKEKDRSTIKVLQMDNIRGLIGIKGMDKVLNTWIRVLYGVSKGIEERVDGVLWWSSHLERTENDNIVKRMYIQ